MRLTQAKRTDRLDSQIQQELMELLQREMKDPRLGFATVTRVETSRDLGHVTVMGLASSAARKSKPPHDGPDGTRPRGCGGSWANGSGCGTSRCSPSGTTIRSSGAIGCCASSTSWRRSAGG